MDDSSEDILSWQDLLLIYSKLDPNGNGNPDKNTNTKPTSGQKWYASVIIGFVFALISSPVAYDMTNTIKGNKIKSKEITLSELTLQTMIFIVIIRIILW